MKSLLYCRYLNLVLGCFGGRHLKHRIIVKCLALFKDLRGKVGLQVGCIFSLQQCKNSEHNSLLFYSDGSEGVVYL